MITKSFLDMVLSAIRETEGHLIIRNTEEESKYAGMYAELSEYIKKHPAYTDNPAEDDKEYREWVEGKVLDWELEIEGHKLSLGMWAKGDLIMDEEQREVSETHIAHLTRLIADIKKGMGARVYNSETMDRFMSRSNPDRREKVEAELLKEQALPPSQWISVKDRLPEKDGNVLALCDKTMYVLWFSNKFYMDFNIKKYFEDWTDQVTHWQPLPEPPKMNC